MNGSEQSPDYAASAPVGRAATLRSLLDARTIAMLTTMVTIGLALGAMVQTAHSRLATDIAELRQDGREDSRDLRTGLADLRDEFKAEIGNLRTDMGKLDARLRTVEIDVGAVREGLNSVKIDVAAIRERLSSVEIDVAAIRQRLSSVEIDVATIRGAVADNTHLGSTEAP